MSDPEVVRRLDAVIAILKIANKEALEEVRAKAQADEVTAAILDATEEDFVSSGELKRQVAAKTNQSERTVLRRIGDLLAMGLLERRSSGPAAYRSTGIL